jgi:hypothetical protein
MKILTKILLVLLSSSSLSLAAVMVADAATGNARAAFSKGSSTFNFVVGSGSAFNDNYTVLGVGVSYYLINGLEIGIDGQYWFSGEPSISKISPQIRYVMTQPEIVKPYIGTFYRRTFIEDLDDADSFGYRAGAYFSGGKGVYVGGGIVYEKYMDCNFGDCSNSYPEVLISVSF